MAMAALARAVRADPRRRRRTQKASDKNAKTRQIVPNHDTWGAVLYSGHPLHSRDGPRQPVHQRGIGGDAPPIRAGNVAETRLLLWRAGMAAPSGLLPKNSAPRGFRSGSEVAQKKTLLSRRFVVSFLP